MFILFAMREPLPQCVTNAPFVCWLVSMLEIVNFLAQQKKLLSNVSSLSYILDVVNTLAKWRGIKTISFVREERGPIFYLITEALPTLFDNQIMSCSLFLISYSNCISAEHETTKKGFSIRNKFQKSLNWDHFFTVHWDSLKNSNFCKKCISAWFPIKNSRFHRVLHWRRQSC